MVLSWPRSGRATNLRICARQSDRVRESIFNLLLNGGYGNPVENARVLDLFAGSGALGLEALSRGAAEAVFVDDGRAAQGLIGRNIGLCRCESQTRLIRRDATRLGPCEVQGFDLVFLDPPYGKGLGEKALTSAQAGGWLAAEALVVWEESAEVSAPEGLTKLDARRYGDTWVTILGLAG